MVTTKLIGIVSDICTQKKPPAPNGADGSMSIPDELHELNKIGFLPIYMPYFSSLSVHIFYIFCTSQTF